jgi:hypothetical protein
LALTKALKTEDWQTSPLLNAWVLEKEGHEGRPGDEAWLYHHLSSARSKVPSLSVSLFPLQSNTETMEPGWQESQRK